MGGSWATRSVKRQQASCGVILVGRSLRRDLASAFRVGVVVQWLVCSSTLSSCSLSFSLRVFEFGNHLKVKQKHK